MPSSKDKQQIYERGFEAGLKRRQETLVLLAETNRALFDEICRLDALDGAGRVHLTVRAAKGILKTLMEAKDYGRARDLKKKIAGVDSERMARFLAEFGL